MHNLVQLVKAVQEAFPDIIFIPGDRWYWSPKTHEVFYKPAGKPGALLHEVGHALLKHDHFTTDVDLLKKEVAAWGKARELAPSFKIKIPEREIDRCLDGYRDWLHSRSTCPKCGAHGLQASQQLYICPDCDTSWKVSGSVLCRPYRRRMGPISAN